MRPINLNNLLKSTPITVVGGLLAMLLGLAGQLLLTRPPDELSGLMLLVLAVVMGVALLCRQPGPHIELATAQPAQRNRLPRQAGVLGGLTLASAALAFALFGSSDSPAIPWVLHLCSIALLIGAAYVMDRANKIEAPPDRPWSRWDIGLLIVIVAVAAFMRLYRFDQIPFGLWYDEAVYGSNALEILNTPNYLPVYAEQPMLPAHFIYLIAAAFKLLGVSVLSIRAVSVAFGLGTLVAAYLTGRELFDRKWGLLLAFMLAVSRWDVNWSRIGMHGVTVPFFELLTLGLILRAVRRQRWLDYTLAGLALGFGLCFYFSFRLFPVVLGVLVLMLWATRRNFLRATWRGLVLFGVSAVIACLPIVQFALAQPDVFWGRVGDTSIFNDKTPEEGWQAVARTTQEHLLMFNYQGDHNGRHNLPGAPMLDPVSGALLVLGIGLSLWRWRQPASLWLLAWLLIMLAPGILSLDYESPQSLRAIGSLPAACLLAIVPLHAWWQAWDRSSVHHSMGYRLVPLGLLMGSAAYFNYTTYFDQQANSAAAWSAFSTPETIAGKIMAQLGNTAEFYVSTFYYETPTIRFLAPDVTRYHRLETYDALPVRTDDQRSLVFLIDADRTQLVTQARRYYPTATYQTYTAPDGTPVLHEVSISPAELQASQGLTARYYANSAWSGQPGVVRQEKSIDVDWDDGDPMSLPFSVEWTGVLLAPVYGNYRFSTHAPSSLELTIDDVPVDFQDGTDQTVEVGLAKGTHSLKVRTIGQAGHFELAWQPPDEDLTPIPSAVLFVPPITNNGLLGRYYPNGDWQDAPAFARVDPWIHFYYQEIPLPRPYTVEWTGDIDIPTDGHYHFGLESIDESLLWIDDQLLVENRSLGEYQEAGLDLAAGRHALRLRFGDRTGYTHINLYWLPPGGDREIIPQQVLFPSQGNPDVLRSPASQAVSAPTINP